MKVLVVADHNNARLDVSAASAVAAGVRLGEVDVLVCGKDCAGAAEQAAHLTGVSKVLVAEAPWLANGLAENLAAQAVACAAGYGAILFGETLAGKGAMPRTAALLGVSPLSGITGIVDEKTFTRQVYAGSINVTVTAGEGVKVMTVRATAFDPAASGDAAAPVEAVSAVADTGLSEFVSREVVASDRPSLVGAKRVVCGGHGLAGEESFKALAALADKLGAAIGATRAAVDAGLCPNDWQVGQTGKIIAPELYIGFGLSGAIQHVAGIKDSGVIVAVNKDPEAPIFDLADYGLVADADATIAELQKLI